MKTIFSPQRQSLFLLISLLAWPLSSSAISDVELNQVMNNADQSYIYCDRDHSKMAAVVTQISKLDGDKNSPIWQLHDYIQQGFSIGRQDAVVDALEWAALFLNKNYNKLNRNEFEEIQSDLNSVMDAIADDQLTVDVESLLDNESLRGDNFNVAKPTTFYKNVKFKDKADFKHFVGFHGNGHFYKNLTVNETLTAGNEIVNCDLTVGCNISMNDSVSSEIGNIIKNGVPFIQNYGLNNTFVGDNAGNFIVTGCGNAGFGTNALQNNTDEQNVAVGSGALQNYVTNGGQHVAVGFNASNANILGAGNTAVGWSALASDVTTDSPYGDNSAFGWNALGSNTLGTENTALGNEALENNVTGLQNTAVGSFALNANIVGDNNTAVGYNALLSSTGYENTAVGSRTMEHTQFGNANTAVGAHALEDNVTGSESTAFGYRAMEHQTNGSNAAFGYRALHSNEDATDNAAFGWNALAENRTGDGNTAMGNSTLTNNTTGSSNTAVGNFALANNTEGISNTAIGSSSLSNNITGDGNTAIGQVALISNITGSGNTAVGVGSSSGNTNGSNNTAVGIGSLSSNITGSSNIALGENAGDALTTGNNNIYIGNVGIAAESGIIRIGTSSTHTAAYMQGIYTTAITGVPVEVNIAGQLGVSPSSAGYKKNIKNMDVNSEDIYKLRPVTFEYNSDEANIMQYGLIAEEVANVFPSLIVNDKNGNPYTVRYQVLPVLLLNEVQKQQASIEALTARVSRLEESAPAA